ncbi:hypothetical protein J4214_02565 [Candidatus Woesearchaeota archaeon]|nr:hypothetical protein [Candidatus Woesearchaeota archaeon]
MEVNEESDGIKQLERITDKLKILYNLPYQPNVFVSGKIYNKKQAST